MEQGLELWAPEDSNEPDAPQASVLQAEGIVAPLTPIRGAATGEDSCTHLSEERGCPSFCHLVGGSMEATSGQKSRTTCPRAACTREGSAPAKLTLERWAVRTCPPGTRARTRALRQCDPSCHGHVRGQRAPWEDKLQKPMDSGTCPPNPHPQAQALPLGLALTAAGAAQSRGDHRAGFP